jgi:hypothetical protein
MKKIILILSVVFLAANVIYAQQKDKKEVKKHPRIEKAIHQLNDAINYMDKAPDDFGGFKAAAITDAKKAVASLKLALNYEPANENTKENKKVNKEDTNKVVKNKSSEEEKHPRIEAAVKDLQDAIDYMNAAPDDFGGYKAAAIADSKQAIASLNKALKYRAKKDEKKKTN